MYFTPAWMLGSMRWMSLMATFLSPAVVGITCITPMAPTGLRVRLVEPRFLVALRHQQQPVEVVLRGVFLEIAR